MDLTPIEWAIVAVVHWGVYESSAYPLGYRRSPWRKTETGRALMFKACAVATFFIVAVVGFWWPFPGYNYVYFAAVAALVIAIRRQRKRMLDRQGRSRSPHAGDF